MKTILSVPILLLLTFGCGAGYPPPTQQVADVQSANRSAIELGAQKEPKAELHLKLAEEQLAKAKAAMEADENEKAERLLMRAKADAELSIALTREESAKVMATKAMEESNSQSSTNAEQGAVQ